MELSHEEKDRIVAEEKLRFETVKSLQTQGGAKSCGIHACGSGLHGCCHCGAFWKGLILGGVLCAVVGCFFHQRNYGNNGGRCYDGSPMTQYQDSPDTGKK
jgi:hypothetical protein